MEAPATLVGRVGATPLLRLTRLVENRLPPKVELWVKAEWFNPGGSVKDRPALNIVRTAMADGRLVGGVRLLDSTSGNTGIAYAMLGAALGFGVTLIMPRNVSEERKRIVSRYGAEIVYSDPLEGSDGARAQAKALQLKTPDAYYYADQYNNEANWRAHYHGTGPEIWEQTRGRMTHFVAGLGTSGTMMGTSRFLKERNPEVRCIALQPHAFHGIEGWKNMDSAVPVGIFRPETVDQIVTVETDPAYEWAEALARQEGILASPSAGAAFGGALDVASTLDSGVVVVLFADSGDRYLSGR